MNWITVIVLTLAGVLALSGMIIAQKPQAKDLIDKLVPFQGIIGVVLLVWGIVNAARVLPHMNDMTGANFPMSILLAVVSTWFARLSLFAAIRRIGSGQIALLWPLQTLTVIGLSVVFLNERLTLVQWIGGTFILVSALLAIERVGGGPMNYSMILRRTPKKGD